MSQYFGQNHTTNNLTGEVWSQGSHSYSGDGGDNEVAIPTSGYSFAYVHCYFTGSGVSSNSYTQFHNDADSHMSMEFSSRYHSQSGGSSNYYGNSSWQQYASNQDCSVGWLCRWWIPVGTWNRVQISGDISWTVNGTGIAKTHVSYQRQGNGAIGKVGCNIDGGGSITGMYFRVLGYR